MINKGILITGLGWLLTVDLIITLSCVLCPSHCGYLINPSNAKNYYEIFSRLFIQFLCCTQEMFFPLFCRISCLSAVLTEIESSEKKLRKKNDEEKQIIIRRQKCSHSKSQMLQRNARNQCYSITPNHIIYFISE